MHSQFQLKTEHFWGGHFDSHMPLLIRLSLVGLGRVREPIHGPAKRKKRGSDQQQEEELLHRAPLWPERIGDATSRGIRERCPSPRFISDHAVLFCTRDTHDMESGCPLRNGGRSHRSNSCCPRECCDEASQFQKIEGLPLLPVSRIAPALSLIWISVSVG